MIIIEKTINEKESETIKVLRNPKDFSHIKASDGVIIIDGERYNIKSIHQRSDGVKIYTVD